MGPAVLRWAVQHRTLEPLASKLSDFRERSPARWTRLGVPDILRARLALTRHDANAVALVERAADTCRWLVVDDNVLTPAFVESFDGEWLAQMPDSTAIGYLGPWLARREAQGSDVGGVPYLAKRLDFLKASPEALIALAGIALMCGDMGLVLRVADALGPDTSGARIRGAHAMAAGQYSDALKLFSVDRHLYADLPAVLHVLALAGRGLTNDLELAQRVASKGARSRGPLAKTFLALGSLVAAAANPGRAHEPSPSAVTASATDCLAPLVEPS